MDDQPISPDRLGDVLPSASTIEKSQLSLFRALPKKGLGLERAIRHLQDDIEPALDKSSRSPHYYGFVTGGATPAAVFADGLVTAYDQNLAFHLPKDTIASTVEDSALRMLCDLLELSQDDWSHRTFTTGATASNLVGFACGREYVIRERAKRLGKVVNVGEDGIHEAMKAVDAEKIQILTTVPHSSVRKAASITGLGRSSVEAIGRSDEPHRFDLEVLKTRLADAKALSIVAISCSEVNTGLFATTAEEMQIIRDLCTDHGAWLHIDAAFGLLVKILPKNDTRYQDLVEGVGGLHLADSICADGHKLLNVPYDCGIFLSRHIDIGTQVFQNQNAAYLDVGPMSGRTVIPPMNIGIENSRRFRALPVYASLAAYGRDGYVEMLERQIGLSRKIAQIMHESPDFELLPPLVGSDTLEDYLRRTYVIVLFRAKDEIINRELVSRINGTRKIYVSGTQWDGKPAARFAVANWQANIERDVALIKEVLASVLK